jgi:excisionase family DNA binding protein
VSVPDWLTARDAAAYLKVDRTTIYRYCEQGLLNFYELKTGGGRRFKKEDLDMLLSTTRTRTDEERAHLVSAAAQLEVLVFPKGRDQGPLFTHVRTDEQWLEMRDLKDLIERAIVHDREYFAGTSALLWLATGLLKDRLALLYRNTSGEQMTREQRERMLAAGLFWDGRAWVPNLPKTTIRVPSPQRAGRLPTRS